eukprot:CAMPEP_0119302974 /NCGR_PEP_ID=MMETSP1333-20130426/4490_1 /TAXON_ID=418940 /ORGANISM="Scyphosphaera apsteinii, Strain RCC1455" /LENGTH=350 /DNA_ID=CAMNT_0007305515 /DNA_START=123 /DNA_END=1172 /DNA_ORIENTATION=+
MLPEMLSWLSVSMAQPPAWRGVQHVPPELQTRGKLQGAPPCLKSFKKQGRGRDACWHLASYRGKPIDIDVLLQLDQNPAEPCSKLMIVRSQPPVLSQPKVGTNSAIATKWCKAGHMLLACEEQASALRGMFVREDLRGQRLSKLFLAIWLRMCKIAGVTPCTRTINKPLLSLSLASFGFTPTNSRGHLVEVTTARRYRDCTAGKPAPSARTAYVRTDFEVNLASAYMVDAATEEMLRHGDLKLAGGPPEFRQALTLRGGFSITTSQQRVPHTFLAPSIVDARAASSDLLESLQRRIAAVNNGAGRRYRVITLVGFLNVHNEPGDPWCTNNVVEQLDHGTIVESIREDGVW